MWRRFVRYLVHLHSPSASVAPCFQLACMPFAFHISSGKSAAIVPMMSGSSYVLHVVDVSARQAHVAMILSLKRPCPKQATDARRRLPAPALDVRGVGAAMRRPERAFVRVSAIVRSILSMTRRRARTRVASARSARCESASRFLLEVAVRVPLAESACPRSSATRAANRSPFSRCHNPACPCLVNTSGTAVCQYLARVEQDLMILRTRTTSSPRPVHPPSTGTRARTLSSGSLR